MFLDIYAYVLYLCALSFSFLIGRGLWFCICAVMKHS